MAWVRLQTHFALQTHECLSIRVHDLEAAIYCLNGPWWFEAPPLLISPTG